MVLTDADLTEARRLYAYDPDTGIVSRKVALGGAAVGPCNPRNDGKGYAKVRLTGHRSVYLHRLAWALHHGSWPEHYVDHINGDRSDNRLSNLRDVPRKTNIRNRHKPSSHNKLGVLGVSTRNNKRYFSRIIADGKLVYLGTFDTVSQAEAAYRTAKAKYHPDVAA